MTDNIVSSFSLEKTPYAECSFVWNEAKKKFEPASYINKIKCCFKKCDNWHNDCEAMCKTTYVNDNNCLSRCKRQQKLCTDNCFTLDVKNVPDSNIKSCAKHSYCLDKDGDLDISCAVNNKEQIIKCCKQNCFPTKNIDCDSFCNYTFNYETDTTDKMIEEPYTAPQAHNINNGYLIFVILIFIVCVLQLICKD